MIGVTFRIDAPSVAKFEKSIQRAVARGLNEGGDKVRTQVQRALKKQTGVSKYSSITSRISTTRAYPQFMAGAIGSNLGSGFSSYGSLSYQIIAKGSGIPIKEFPVHLVDGAVDAKTWGVDHVFKRSFEIKGRGIEGARARILNPDFAPGTKRYIKTKTGKTVDTKWRLRRLYGPSLPKEMLRGDGETLAAFRASVPLFVPPAVLRHLIRAI